MRQADRDSVAVCKLPEDTGRLAAESVGCKSQLRIVIKRELERERVHFIAEFQ